MSAQIYWYKRNIYILIIIITIINIINNNNRRETFGELWMKYYLPVSKGYACRYLYLPIYLYTIGKSISRDSFLIRK